MIDRILSLRPYDAAPLLPVCNNQGRCRDAWPSRIPRRP